MLRVFKDCNLQPGSNFIKIFIFVQCNLIQNVISGSINRYCMDNYITQSSSA